MAEEEERAKDDLEKGSTAAPSGDDSKDAAVEVAVAAASDPVDVNASLKASETFKHEKIDVSGEKASEKQAIARGKAGAGEPPASEDNATKPPEEVSVVATPLPDENSKQKERSSKSVTPSATVSESDISCLEGGKKTTLNLRDSTSTPGAFYISNPLGASTAHNTHDSDESFEIVAPILVQTESIVVAEVAPEQENSGGETGNTKEEDERTCRWILAAAAAVVIALMIVFFLVKKQQSVPSPTQQPEQSERKASIIDVLSPFVVSNPDIFDPESPEASSDRIRALEWLVATDPMQIEPTSEENIHKLRQRFVLALTYYATKGENWDNQYSFLSRFDECTWHSARSTAKESSEFWFPVEGFEVTGSVCNKDGWLEELNIYWNNLAGTLPPEITYFKKSLHRLVLGGGALQGTIPESYGEFESLESLSFFDNCLTGMIPEGLAKIPTLQLLTMYSNHGLYGSLNSFCNHSVYRDGIVVVAGDNCNTNETDYGVDCDCCNCCDPDDYWCVDPIWGGFSSYFTDMTDDGYVKNFQKPCMSEEQKAWVDENCPCMIICIARDQHLMGYILTLSNLFEDWARFISETCPGSPPIESFPTLAINYEHPRSKDSLGFYPAAKDVCKERGSIARALCLLHFLDFASWTDLSEGISELCADVYRKHSEVILKTMPQ